jgi:hypothetical protein
MRIRSTKPEFWRSERIASVSWDARLLLKGLESYVDDNGVGKDDIALIVGDLFQRDLIREASRTLARVSEGLTELSEAGLLWRYESEGTKLLFVAFWEDVQRIDHAAKGRFPRPDGTLNYGDSKIRDALATSREVSRDVATGTGEQGNRGTGEETLCATNVAPDGFDAFWDAYDKKRDRKKAEQKYRLALKKPGVTPALLLAAASAYIDYQRRDGKHPEFTKDPTTWLNGECWNNELPANRLPVKSRRQQETDDLFSRAAERMGVTSNIREIA